MAPRWALQSKHTLSLSGGTTGIFACVLGPFRVTETDQSPSNWDPAAGEPRDGIVLERSRISRVNRESQLCSPLSTLLKPALHAQ
jgi:hypothetical protein